MSLGRRQAVKVAQKILRHANIETTLAIYTHLDGIEDMRAAVAKLDFGPLEERAPAPIVPLRKTATFATNLLPAARIPKGEAPDRAGKASKIRGLDWSGRLDLNQRPLAPQAPPAAAQPPPDLPKPSESLGVQGDAPVQGSQGSTTIHRNFATNLLPPVEQLLTVRQVAQLLGVCRATVYKWAAIELLPHVRVVNVIRVRPRDLGAFIASRPPTS